MQKHNEKEEKITLWEAFKKWHHALGEYWLHNVKALNLDEDYALDLVCDTDPDIWEGECSADPAIYEDVKRITQKESEMKVAPKDGYSEIREALNQAFGYSKEYAEAFRKAKEAITFEVWAKC